MHHIFRDRDVDQMVALYRQYMRASSWAAGVDGQPVQEFPLHRKIEVAQENLRIEEGYEIKIGDEVLVTSVVSIFLSGKRAWFMKSTNHCDSEVFLPFLREALHRIYSEGIFRRNHSRAGYEDKKLGIAYRNTPDTDWFMNFRGKGIMFDMHANSERHGRLGHGHYYGRIVTVR